MIYFFLEKMNKFSYTSFKFRGYKMLNNFSRGICSIGNLNPRPIGITYRDVSSAWGAVANSFCIVGTV